MTSPHSAPDGFSPLFSNAPSDHASSDRQALDPAATQKRSEPNGDHHLAFVDLADSDPGGR